MLRDEAAFFFVETVRRRNRVFESFPHRYFFIFVLVGRGSLERFQKIVIKDNVIAFLTASRRGNDDTIFGRQFFDCRAAGGCP